MATKADLQRLFFLNTLGLTAEEGARLSISDLEYMYAQAPTGGGGGDSVTVNGIEPVNGNITLTASNVGAAPINHGHAPSDVTNLGETIDNRVNDFIVVNGVRPENGSITLSASNIGAAPASHEHVPGDVTDLSDTIDDRVNDFIVVNGVRPEDGSITLTASNIGAAPASHGHVPGDVSDLEEAIDDRVNDLIVPDTGITKTYDDAAGSLTLGLAHELRGTGAPEGAVTAPIGTYYTDTAGTGGVWRWLKTVGTGNTGWEVVYGSGGGKG